MDYIDAEDVYTIGITKYIQDEVQVSACSINHARLVVEGREKIYSIFPGVTRYRIDFIHKENKKEE